MKQKVLDKHHFIELNFKNVVKICNMLKNERFY